RPLDLHAVTARLGPPVVRFRILLASTVELGLAQAPNRDRTRSRARASLAPARLFDLGLCCIKLNHARGQRPLDERHLARACRARFGFYARLLVSHRHLLCLAVQRSPATPPPWPCAHAWSNFVRSRAAA